MQKNSVPNTFLQLQSEGCIKESDVATTRDGFFVVDKSLAEILAEKDIFDFLNSEGRRLECSKFFDDWFLYAVLNENGYTYSLLKLREQEHDGEDGAADGDTPGVTVSFIAFDCEKLLCCLADPTEENRTKLNGEINRVVAYRGERHHVILKRYFTDPKSLGAYLIADTYAKRIASLAPKGYVETPGKYRELAKKSRSGLPRFIETLNKTAGYMVCDNEKIYIQNKDDLTQYERDAILATHTGNMSVRSFATEVKFHARFLTPLARIKFPFWGRSVYDSAIRADMTVDESRFAVFVWSMLEKI